MVIKTPPMGWNTWNTFGENINEDLIKGVVDTMVNEGYRDAGYEYVVIDDCWALRERDEKGNLVADPKKFPNGMKALADYIHANGLKFGMYSCAGVLTCAGYPSSFDHEYQDAKTFASWGVDYLKYDYCYFPLTGNCKNRYLTMSQALRASGRDIVFSACNWGVEEPWTWMRGAGAHLYRSTGDITDSFASTKSIILQQYDKFNSNGVNCYNDIDMLTVGMYGEGNVKTGMANTFEDYETEFAFWCFMGAPLMMGADIRKLDEKTRDLLQNKALIAINQDEEQRSPFVVRRNGDRLQMIKEISNNEFIFAYFNLEDFYAGEFVMLNELGVPMISGAAVEIYDVLTGEYVGKFVDDFRIFADAHRSKLYRCKVVDRNDVATNCPEKKVY